MNLYFSRDIPNIMRCDACERYYIHDKNNPLCGKYRLSFFAFNVFEHPYTLSKCPFCSKESQYENHQITFGISGLNWTFLWFLYFLLIESIFMLFFLYDQFLGLFFVCSITVIGGSSLVILYFKSWKNFSSYSYKEMKKVLDELNINVKKYKGLEKYLQIKKKKKWSHPWVWCEG